MSTRPTELVIDELAQDIAVAPRLVMGGGVHADAAAATVARGRLSGDPKHHSTSSGLELEEAR
jgi:hypothetical protein